MSNITTSVLLPSYRGPERLRKAVASLFSMAAEPEKVEVLVRLQETDPRWTRELLRAWELVFPNAFFTKGPWLQGHDSLHTYYQELAERARGKWLWIFNDDAWVHGRAWDQMLPTTDAVCMVLPIVQNVNRAGSLCEYSHFEKHHPFPILPRQYVPAVWPQEHLDVWICGLFDSMNAKRYWLDHCYVTHLFEGRSNISQELWLQEM